ncbi:uncharacterized protein LOC128553505 [Mercenaria mercenaria]|uniref:uncharacterized protein LOC128553505 n=1 Tax=Mercenaria mercenaria TaxID=6596 RepID=UPI00234F7F9F|nr:uncharacterized protein LOC128553505 [Mercenaria mercenaria]
MDRKGKQTETKAKTDSRGRGRERHNHDVEEMDTSPMDTENPHGHCHPGELAQRQHQLQRSVEASKQMLYGVFGNVITILEEYERRELAKYRMEHNMPKSDIYIPDQTHKNFEDIKSNVDTQLLLFETQTKACPPEALAEVLDELKRRTLAWSAVRQEMGIKEIQQTDYYMSKLYEILAKGATNHGPVESQEVTEGVMKESFQAIMYGDHDRAELDREFKNNPDKKATGPNTRSSEMLQDGASRLSRARGNQELDGYLKEDVNKFQGHGPEDLK